MVEFMHLAAQLAAKRGGMAAKLAASMPLAAKRGGTAAWRQSQSLGGKAGNASRAAPMLKCTFLPSARHAGGRGGVQFQSVSVAASH